MKTAQDAINAIRLIPECDFNQEAAIQLIACISSRVSHSNFSHIQNDRVDCYAAVEHLDDAQHFLGE